jgi:hypothetical protein
MSSPEQPTYADRIILDLEGQLSEPDPRYARKCRDLAIARAQLAELSAFVEKNREVLGLSEEGVPVSAPTADPAPESGKPGKSDLNGSAVNGAAVKGAPKT